MPINAELANDNWLRYVYVRDNGHLDYVLKANKCDAFYLGKQWDPVVKQQLDNQRRPALTINKVLSTLSNVQGDQIQTRAETTFKPLHVSGEDLSNVLAVLYKQVAGRNMLPWKESEVFADGAITSRGFFDLRLSFADNTQGECEITVPNPRNVLIDPDAEEYDPDTWKETIETKWLNSNDIAVLYNQEDADYLEMNNTNPFATDIDSIQHSLDRFGGLGHGIQYDKTSRKLARNIRVISRQYKKLTKQRYFVDTRTGDQRLIPEDWSRDRIAFVRSQYDLGVLERVSERIRWTTTAGQCLLHDAWSPYKHFTQVPYFPYFRRGQTMGLVENLLDPQELLNKVSSQELHIVNTTANSGWKVKKGSLKNMDAEELEQRGAQTGVVFELDDVDDMEKIQPNQIPTGIERISYKAEEHIKSISNIDDNALGQDREDVSSKAIKAKRQRGSVNQLKIMENLNMTRALLARNVVDIWQEYYTEPRMYRVVYGNPITQAAQQGAADENEFLKLNQFDEVTGQIMNDLTLGEYDAVITSQPASDTIEESEFEQCMAMREAGIMLPDDVIISHSLLREKREIVQRMATPTPEAQAQKQLAFQGQSEQVRKIGAEADKTKADALLKTASAQAKVAEMVTAAPEQPGESGTDLMAQVMQNHADASAQASDQAHEKQMQDEKHAHEKQMSTHDKAHEAGIAAMTHQQTIEQVGAESAKDQQMAATEHKHATQQTEQSAKNTAKQADQAAKHTEKQQKAATEGAIKVAKAKPKPKPASKGK